MAHKKGQGSSKNGRDSNPQYRGIKLYGGQFAIPGNILVRQCGTKFLPGYGVQRGKDDTLFSVSTGKVVFQGRRVHIDPVEDDAPRPRWLTQYRAQKLAEAASRN